MTIHADYVCFDTKAEQEIYELTDALEERDEIIAEAEENDRIARALCDRLLAKIKGLEKQIADMKKK